MGDRNENFNQSGASRRPVRTDRVLIYADDVERSGRSGCDRGAGGQQDVDASVGVGELTYECREKQGAAGTFEWTFVAPTATLWDANRTKAVGKYYGGPTWESSDGSKVTGKQLATAPATNAGAIPLQLVQAAPAMGTGAMQGVTYIQR